MEQLLDLNVSFLGKNGRKIVLDAEDLDTLIRGIWAKGEEKDGTRYIVLETDGYAPLKAFVKEKTGLELTYGETLALWEACNAPPDKDGVPQDPWSQKKRKLRERTATTPSSPASTPDTSLDPRYMPDPDDLPTKAA